MSIENLLTERAESLCEICRSAEKLVAYNVQPHNGADLANHVLLCQKCLNGLDEPGARPDSDWYGLKDSMWSEHLPVQVLAYRILKQIPATWAQDLIEQLYLDEEAKKWAEDGLPQGDENKIPTVDSNGTKLGSGDTVTLIKDLDVKGANFTAKRGTTVKNISLTDDPKFIEGKVNGTQIVLVASFLKKA